MEFTISPNQLASEKKRNQHLLRKHFQTWRKSGVGKLVRELQAQYMAEDGSDLEFREQTADEKAKHLHRIKLTQAQQTIFWRVTSPWVEERGGGKQNSKIEGLTYEYLYLTSEQTKFAELLVGSVLCCGEVNCFSEFYAALLGPSLKGTGTHPPGQQGVLRMLRLPREPQTPYPLADEIVKYIQKNLAK
jgi:hypothetical protein